MPQSDDGESTYHDDALGRRKKLIEEDHTMIRYPYKDEIRKYLIPDHPMIPSINNDNLSPKRTPEDRA